LLQRSYEAFISEESKSKTQGKGKEVNLNPQLLISFFSYLQRALFNIAVPVFFTSAVFTVLKWDITYLFCTIFI